MGGLRGCQGQGETPFQANLRAIGKQGDNKMLGALTLLELSTVTSDFGDYLVRRLIPALTWWTAPSHLFFLASFRAGPVPPRCP